MSLQLSVIRVDANTQARSAIDQAVVADYAAQMQNGAKFPAVVVFHDGSNYYLADGFHRTMAAQRNGLVEIPADIRKGTQEDALWFALGANREQGHRMTPADKKHAIMLAIKTWPERSTTMVAAQIGVDQQRVAEEKKHLTVSGKVTFPERVTGKDGKSYPASRPQVPKEHPKAAEIVDRLKTGESPTAVAKALGVAPATVQKVRKDRGQTWTDKSRAAVTERRERMRQLAAEGYTSIQIAAELGLSLDGCRTTLKNEGIDVPADRATKNSKRLDSTRIVENIVLDAEGLTTDVNLIDFASIDRDRLTAWIDSLIASKRALTSFIQRLTKERG